MPKHVSTSTKMHRITTFTENKTALKKLKGLSSSLFPRAMMDKWQAFATKMIRDAPREHQIAAKKNKLWQTAIQRGGKDPVLVELWHALLVIQPVVGDEFNDSYAKLLPSDTFQSVQAFSMRENLYFFLADHHLRQISAVDAAAAQ